MYLSENNESESNRAAKDLDDRCAEMDRLENSLKIKESKFEHEKEMLEKERIKFEEEIKSFFEEVKSQYNKIEGEKTKLIKRENAIIEAEEKRDAGFADALASLNIKLREKRAEIEFEIDNLREQKFSSLEDEIAKLKTKRLEETTKAEQAERIRIRTEIANEQDVWAKQQEAVRKRLEIERSELEKQKSALSALQSELEGRNAELEANERTLERKALRLEQQWQKRNNELDDILDERLEEERRSQETEKKSYKDANASLRESIRHQTELVDAFDQLKRQLGDKDPAEIIRDLNSKTDELKRLREELNSRPTEEMRERYKNMESESQRLRAHIEKLEIQINDNASAIAETNSLRFENSELKGENKSLKNMCVVIEADNNRLTEDLRRIQASYEREQDREARIRDIEVPYIKKALPRQDKEIDELKWLDRIGKSCVDYGIKFPKRILYAFHTALKTSEWSPITVLAGASGTGKSELPRLYSHFGGINFLSLSVQPNWDSQESMLGFFNSIDNKFDAQPVLRLLAQSQKTQNDDYPYGLEDVMSLILMDEMNLAHVELYFAEFLSKLELRRGRKRNDVPCLEVKLGAGIQQYELPLGRNILWSGTMNQDETTKSLSDKVLDRGIVINFPRPTQLERRKQLKALGEQAPLLSRKIWEKWWCKESVFTDDQILPYKHFVEEMNESLSKVGRALGHRVWQSIEYYMANYPDVLEAQRANDEVLLAKSMKIAFEDQLVQKVMPKLRGIETRGRGRNECLDKIKSQLVEDEYAIVDDFNLACEFGYGQFIWSSANYLKDEEPAVKQSPAEQAKVVPQAEISVVEENPDVSIDDVGMSAQLLKKILEAGFKSVKDIPVDNPKKLKDAGFKMTEIAEIRKILSV